VGAIAIAVAISVVAPLSTQAEEAASQIPNLEQRLMALEDRLAASEATVASQKKVISAANLDSALARDEGNVSFWNGVVMGGHVAASYSYNWNNPSAGAGAQPLNTFNNAHNEFQLDAAKLEIGRPTDGPGTAGFQFDILYGQNADILRGISPSLVAGQPGFPTAPVNVPALQGDDEASFFLQQAYVSYNLNGVELKLGRWETLLGYEMLDTNDNPNISHGLLFTWAIPFYHTGLLASGNITENLSWSAGIANGFNNSTENNDQKAAVGQLAFESGNFGTRLSGYYGFDNQTGQATAPVTSSDSNYVLDLVTTFQATDALGFWLNVDYGEAEDLHPLNGDDARWWGYSAGAKFDISDSTYFALRYEHLEDEETIRVSPGTARNFEADSITGTLGHQLTDRLLVRAEVRYDQADDDAIPTGGAIFPDDSAVGVEDDEVFAIVEAVFSLD
jgi:hypothetical protein